MSSNFSYAGISCDDGGQHPASRNAETMPWPATGVRVRETVARYVPGPRDEVVNVDGAVEGCKAAYGKGRSTNGEGLNRLN